MSESGEHITSSVTLDKIADQFRSDDVSSIVQSISSDIRSHARAVGINRNPTILESRFMPAQEAYDRGIVSCGVMANISSEMLKHLGYQVKLVHGEIPSTPTHAWIAVFNKDTETWDQYDPTEKDARVTEDHKAKYIVDSWEEIRPEIEAYYRRNHPDETE